MTSTRRTSSTSSRSFLDRVSAEDFAEAEAQAEAEARQKPRRRSTRTKTEARGPAAGASTQCQKTAASATLLKAECTSMPG